MVDSLFDHEPFHDEKVKLIRKDQLGIKIESGNRSGRQGYADSIMLGDLHAERHLTSFRVGCEAREPASTGFKAQPVSGANVLVFSISIQKNGPPLRTADESSSADFHGGWTSDRNRCIAVTSSPHSLPLEPCPKLVAKHRQSNSPQAELAQPNKP